MLDCQPKLEALLRTACGLDQANKPIALKADAAEQCQWMQGQLESINYPDTMKYNKLDLAFKIVLRQMMNAKGKQVSAAVTDLYLPAQRMIDLALDLALWRNDQKLFDVSLGLKLVELMLEHETIDGCILVFNFLYARIEKVCQPMLFPPISKLAFLRLCNRLLRRLSTTTHASFCGKILMLMAYVLPLDERSGVNVVGKYHLGNTTAYERAEKEMELQQKEGGKKDGAGDKQEEGKTMDVDKGSVEERKKKEEEEKKEANAVDLVFYRTLWSLQDYFRDPQQLGESPAHFVACFHALNVVLQAFESQKLSEADYTSASSSSSSTIASTTTTATSSSTTSSSVATERYFPKYLTSSSLLNLQLRDPLFRRHLLVQCALLFDSVLVTVMEKRLAAKQRDLVSSCQARVFDLLRDTPPNGPAFVLEVQAMLKSERKWANWKSQKPPCPPMSKEPTNNLGVKLLPPTVTSTSTTTSAATSTTTKEESSTAAGEENKSGRKSSRNASSAAEKKEQKEKEERERWLDPSLLMQPIPVSKFGEYKESMIRDVDGRIKLGNADLANLWGISFGNLQSCLEQDFTSDSDQLTNFMEQMKDDEDPLNDVEEEMKMKNDARFQFRTFRVMLACNFKQYVDTAGSLGIAVAAALKAEGKGPIDNLPPPAAVSSTTTTTTTTTTASSPTAATSATTPPPLEDVDDGMVELDESAGDETRDTKKRKVSAMEGEE